MARPNPKTDTFYALTPTNKSRIAAHIGTNPVLNTSVYFREAMVQDINNIGHAMSSLAAEYHNLHTHAAVSPTDKQIANIHLRMLAKLDRVEELINTMALVAEDVINAAAKGRIQIDDVEFAQMQHVIKSVFSNVDEVLQSVSEKREQILKKGKVKAHYGAASANPSGAKPKPRMG